MLKVKVKCPVCGREVEVNERKLKKEKCSLINKEGVSIFLTYYDCPVCQQQVALQVDDEETMSILDDIKKLFVNNSKCRLEGEDIPHENLERFEKARKDLKRLRGFLSDTLNGCPIYNEVAKKITLIRFGIF